MPTQNQNTISPNPSPSNTPIGSVPPTSNQSSVQSSQQVNNPSTTQMGQLRPNIPANAAQPRPTPLTSQANTVSTSFANNFPPSNQSTNQNIIDSKHLGFMNQTNNNAKPLQPAPAQNPTPLQQSTIASPGPQEMPNYAYQSGNRPQTPPPIRQSDTGQANTFKPLNAAPQTNNSTTFQSSNPQISRNDFINPSNIQQKIQQPVKPQNVQELKQVAFNANKLQPVNQMQVGYDSLEKQSRVVQINTYDVLKLCIYIVPGVQVFLLLLKSIKDETVMWHARQSLIAQVLWLMVLTIFNLINFPLISGGGFSLATIWNILMIGLLIYAGAMAYAGKIWRIPVIAEIGTVFIDGKSEA